MSGLRAIISGSVVIIGVAIGVPLLQLFSHHAQEPQLLRLDRVGTDGGGVGMIVRHVQVIPDDLRQKYSPTKRVEFHVSCGHDISIAVWATGVEVHTPSGWQMSSEEYHGEIWRLTNGVVREVCVERPNADRWRAYIRYGTEMKGAPLVKAQMKEAWLNRSFSNWTGKAWGGGRWSGAYELRSEEIKQ